MKTTEIKKELYKQNPDAHLRHIRIGIAYYYALLEPSKIILFEIPISDMGTADFYPIMGSKLLNRWIVLSFEEENEKSVNVIKNKKL